MSSRHVEMCNKLPPNSTEAAQEGALVRAIAKRLRRLEDRLGPADGMLRHLLCVCHAGWGLAQFRSRRKAEEAAAQQ